MSTVTTGAYAIVLDRKFVEEEIIPEELKALKEVVNNLGLDLDTVFEAIASGPLENEFDEQTCAILDPLGHKLGEKFKQKTGLTLYYFYVSDDFAEGYIFEEGYNYCLAHEEVYEVKAKAKAIEQNWSLHAWSEFSN